MKEEQTGRMCRFHGVDEKDKTSFEKSNRKESFGRCRHRLKDVGMYEGRATSGLCTATIADLLD